MKIPIAIMAIFLPVVANAVTMCVHSDSYVATLLRSHDGVSDTVDGNGGWTVTFDYYTSSLNTMDVSGHAACNEVSGTENVADGTLSTSTSDEGTNCWCAMSRPLVSDWVYSGAYSNDATCATSCATACANKVKTSTVFRTALYESIW